MSNSTQIQPAMVLAAIYLVSAAVPASAIISSPLDANYYRGSTPAPATDVRAPAPPLPTTPSVATHHVYSCEYVNRMWIDSVVPNVPGGPTSDVLDPNYHTWCPLGDPRLEFMGTASKIEQPYDDSQNPLDPAHRFR